MTPNIMFRNATNINSHGKSSTDKLTQSDIYTTHNFDNSQNGGALNDKKGSIALNFRADLTPDYLSRVEELREKQINHLQAQLSRVEFEVTKKEFMICQAIRTILFTQFNPDQGLEITDGQNNGEAYGESSGLSTDQFSHTLSNQ